MSLTVQTFAKSLVAATAAACLVTPAIARKVEIGDVDAKTEVTGSAAGSSTSGGNTELEKCPTPFGTMSVYEDSSAPWYARMQSMNLVSTIPVLRLLIQQSNCFVVVERGAAMGGMTKERELMESGELRSGSNFGKGQMVAADYTMNPTITFSEKDTGGFGAALGGLLGGDIGAAIGGGISFSDASTVLTLLDNRSGVQIAAAEGSARGTNFALGGLLGGSGGIGGAGGFSKTPEGKVLIGAFADSYNNMVRSLRNYKAQQVDGGLGKGGQLQIGQ